MSATISAPSERMSVEFKNVKLKSVSQLVIESVLLVSELVNHVKQEKKYN